MRLRFVNASRLLLSPIKLMISTCTKSRNGIYSNSYSLLSRSLESEELTINTSSCTATTTRRALTTTKVTSKEEEEEETSNILSNMIKLTSMTEASCNDNANATPCEKLVRQSCLTNLFRPMKLDSEIITKISRIFKCPN